MAKGGQKQPFVCPKCGYADGVFHSVGPSCVRPFVRDYTDTQVHLRDPDQGTLMHVLRLQVYRETGT